MAYNDHSFTYSPSNKTILLYWKDNKNLSVRSPPTPTPCSSSTGWSGRKSNFPLFCYEPLNCSLLWDPGVFDDTDAEAVKVFRGRDAWHDGDGGLALLQVHPQLLCGRQHAVLAPARVQGGVRAVNEQIDFAMPLEGQKLSYRHLDNCFVGVQGLRHHIGPFNQEQRHPPAFNY